MSTSSLRELRGSDLDDVIEVHSAAFAGFLMTNLGPSFLREYYQAVLEGDDAILLGQFDELGSLKGFVAGSAKPALLYARLAKRKPRMLISAAFHLLCHPVLWLRVLENANTTSRRAREDVAIGAELASIAVHPSAQGLGYGRALIEAFLSSARRYGASEVTLTTDADDNDAVNRLYRRAGFRLSRTSTRKGGRRMNHYNIALAREPLLRPQEEA